MDEEYYSEPKIEFPTVGSLELCKKNFFDGNTIAFMEELRSNHFKIYFAEYKYVHDYEHKPSFIVDNLLRGFVQQLENKRKYLFVCFKCLQKNGSYIIQAIWICNCPIPMEEIVSDKYDDFEWEELDVNIYSHAQKIWHIMHKEPSNNLVSIQYLH